ncbi:MAG: L,D-transpeptidase [Proteobacteria bacterium]|nr:L,D-transpeptidase [Pseudomonadota bacterium]MBU1710640.1 L,D-transpeptidase [Pseudomonadota bacterium]
MKISFPLLWANKTKILLFGAVMLAGGALFFFGFPKIPDGNAGIAAPAPTKAKNRKGDDVAALRKKLNALSPQGIHVVIDTGQNLLFIRKGEQTLHRALVSTGSGNVLQDPSGERKWIFDTPRGVFSVGSKTRKPYWVKPDWAFIEEGEAIPKSYNDRIEAGGLGEYAVGIGNGYFIHGTLYTRLLGRNVTHGCIRMADEDLKRLYQTVPIGAKVMIF